MRFGDGAWHGTEADPPLEYRCRRCVPRRWPSACTIPRASHARCCSSYRADEWVHWFAAAGQPARCRGPVFDSSLTMASAAAAGAGVALLPPAMFANDLADGRLVRPFAHEVVTGRYWLAR